MRTPHGGDTCKFLTVDNVGTLEYRKAPGQTVEIVDIFVEYAFQRKGVGTRLFRSLESMYHGCSVYAFFRQDNVDAAMFYHACGFLTNTLIYDFYGKGQHARLAHKVCE